MLGIGSSSSDWIEGTSSRSAFSEWLIRLSAKLWRRPSTAFGVVLIGSVLSALIVVVINILLSEWNSILLLFNHLGHTGLILTLFLLVVVFALLVLLYRAGPNGGYTPLSLRPIFCSVIGLHGAGRDCRHPDATLPAFKAAIRLGVDLVYAEVWYLPQSDAIVIGRGGSQIEMNERLPQMSLGQVRRLRVGVVKGNDGKNRMYRMATLKQLLRALKPSNVGVLIYLKGPGWTENDGLGTLVDCINRESIGSRIRIGCDDIPKLAKVSNILPTLPVSFFFSTRKYREFATRMKVRSRDVIELARKAGAWQVILREDLISEAMVSDIRAASFDVLCMFPDSDSESDSGFRRVIEAGVAGVITGNPQRLSSQLTRLREGGVGDDADDSDEQGIYPYSSI